MNSTLSNAIVAFFLCTFLFISKSSVAQSCGCDHTLQPAADGGIYFTNGNGTKVLPGEKVCIKGGYYPYISLNGLVGTASQPITIINCGGQVIVGSGSSYCYRIVKSRFIKFSGTGSPGVTYGFKSYWPGGFTAAGMSVRDSSSDYEIDHFEAQNSQNGFLCKIDPYDCDPGTWSTGWTIKNVSIHDNYVHNTIGEGMYLINTAVTQDVTNCSGQTITIEPVQANGMKVYNNIIDSTGWDGIQVAASSNADIYGNKVTNYGRQNLGSQQAGIILGGKSNGAIHDNYISGGTGEGLEVFGSGKVNIYNNIIANAGWDASSAGQDAIAVDDRPQPNNKYTGLQVYVMNNTIVNAARNAIHLFNSYNTMAQGNKIYNNLLVKPNNTSIYDNPYTNIDGNTNVDTLNNVKIPAIANAFFINANGNNFHLQANSPAIDKGLNAGSYGIIKDYGGLSRPQGASIDAGAYEYDFGTPAVNQLPVANAGIDKVITLPTNTVSLAGSATDADGTVSSYVWTKISGPSSATITNATSANTIITSLVQGIYLFELKVTDNNNAVGKDTVQVTVNAAANIPPVANAGVDKIITLPTNSISITGTGTDADGIISSYTWTKISGPSSATITNAISANTTITSLIQGIYFFEFKVIDNNGAIAKDTMQVTVNAAANIPPVANAGADKIITLPINSISITGTGTDADGIISSYTWTKISGPSSATITNAISANTTITSLIQGIYFFEFKVIDNNGAIAKDTMQVTVNAAANIPPVANAGADKIITLPINSISITGTGTDADGIISSYAWSKVSGPSSASIMNSTSANTTITSLVQGVYLFELKVTDNNGAIAKDTVQVTVNAAANIPPVANAGTDKIITLPTNNVSITGTGTDADGTISSYAWTKISGPSSVTITNATSANTTITSLVQGIYLFELKVTDNNGAIAKDTVQVTVNAAANIPPVANAGTDKIITLPTNNILIIGSGTDVDGTISSYAWTKISGPSSVNITNATSAAASITLLVQGVYQFKLKVTDNNGATARDTVQVIVNPAANIPPVANAGTDKIITLPTNSISITGTGTDPDGTISGYAWTIVSGPSSRVITNATSANTTITTLVQGVYLFELEVTDNNNSVGKDTVQVTVNAAVNIPPVANAGTDKTITLPTNSTAITGSGSDTDGTISSYAWAKISGPSSGVIVNATSANTTITSLLQGVYLLELIVIDNNGAMAKDTVQVTVNAPANVPPVANAGADLIITLPANIASLAGSGGDADGSISNYKWSEISGPTSYNIINAASPITDVSGLVQGTYSFELEVTDNSGATATDTLQVIVNAAAINILPAANAGPDQTITLPLDSTILFGNGIDADGRIQGYAWRQISGPSNSIIDSASTAQTLIKNLAGGSYNYELTVTDNLGAQATDTVNIVVAVPRLAIQYGKLKVYPNPITDIAILEITSLKSNTALSVVVTDMQGNVVFNQQLQGGQNTIFDKIDLSNLAEGMYALTVYFNAVEKQTIKIARVN